MTTKKLTGTDLAMVPLTTEDADIYMFRIAPHRGYMNAFRDDAMIMNGRTQTTKRDKHTPVTLQQLIMTLEEMFNL